MMVGGAGRCEGTVGNTSGVVARATRPTCCSSIARNGCIKEMGRVRWDSMWNTLLLLVHWCLTICFETTCAEDPCLTWSMWFRTRTVCVGATIAYVELVAGNTHSWRKWSLSAIDRTQL